MRRRKPGKGIRRRTRHPTMPIMDIPMVCQYLGLSKSKVYALVRSGDMPATKIGTVVRFHMDTLRLWLSHKRIDEGGTEMFCECGASFKAKHAIKGKVPGTVVCPACKRETMSTGGTHSDKGTVVESPRTTTLTGTQTGTESPKGSTLKETP